MIAAIAIMSGYDVSDDRVKSLVYACMAGNAAKEILRDTGIKFTEKLALGAIKHIPGKTLTVINQKVGFRLLTKFGEKGVVTIGKALPLVGLLSVRPLKPSPPTQWAMLRETSFARRNPSSFERALACSPILFP